MTALLGFLQLIDSGKPWRGRHGPKDLGNRRPRWDGLYQDKFQKGCVQGQL